ncbi:MAG: hypothetical protein NTY35_03970 [Planctomycetota bacterium]|nr:hypothetical protein [Planctomycetota bacterium]
MPFVAMLLALVPSFSAGGPIEDPRPEITHLVTDLDAAVEKNGKGDTQAIEIVGRLAGMYEKCTPAERELVVKQVGRALRDPRPRPDKKSFEDRLAMASAQALGSMGDAGAKELAPALALKHFRIDGPLTEETIAQLGRTRAKQAIDPLLEMAGTRSLYCVRGAARGAAYWGEADGATRKKLFEGLLKPMQSMADEVRSSSVAVGGPVIVAKEIFEGAREAAYAAYSELSGVSEARDIDAWLAWWNNNKTKSWDKKKT